MSRLRFMLMLVTAAGLSAAPTTTAWGQTVPANSPPFGTGPIQPALSAVPTALDPTLPYAGGVAMRPQPYTIPASAPAPPGYAIGPPNSPFAAAVSGTQPPAPDVIPCQPLVASNWYTQVDYFHWNERVAGADFVNESGALFTLGYERRIGNERFRAEFFAGDMTYDGGLELDDGSTEPSTSRTRYRGFAGEFEHLFTPDSWPNGMLFIGIGSRFWIRDIRSGLGEYGDWSDETQETWWTIYPYLGFEIKRPLADGLEAYCLARAGATALTYNYSNAYFLPVYPRMGVEGELELGLRGEHFSLSASCEVMTWSQSADQYFLTTDSNGNSYIAAVNQPDSTMLLLGGKLGWSF